MYEDDFLEMDYEDRNGVYHETDIEEEDESDISDEEDEQELFDRFNRIQDGVLDFPTKLHKED